MTGIVDWAVSRGRMILALAALSIAVGWAAYVGLPKEGEPDIDIPTVYVSMTLDGVSATDAERLMVKPLEKELRELENLKELTTYATEGRATAVLEFEFGWDKAAALADVRDRTDRAQAEMPADIDEPQVFEVNLSEFPVMVVALSGAAPERTLLRVAKQMERELEALGPVLNVGLAGHRDERIEVIIDPTKLEGYDLAPRELIDRITASNRLVAAGDLLSQTGDFPVRVPGSFEQARDALDLALKANGDRVVTLGDIAEIRRTFEDAAGTARYNGAGTVALQISKRPGENIIDTVALVRAKVEEMRADWPEPLRRALTVDFAMDRSAEVADMVSQLEGAVLTAVFLVILVLVATLGLRSALLVGLAVPCSFLLAFALFGALGFTISNMAMFGLILAVGMLVDGAIVVAEYAEKKLAEGMPPDEAYAEAARRMFWPIVSSTATTLCAFLPMLFWPGLAGQFMSLLPITLIFVLSASLLVALIYVPVFGAILGRISAALGAGAQRLAPARLRGGSKSAVAPAPADPEAPNAPRTAFGRTLRGVAGRPAGPFLALAAAVAAVYGSFAFYGANAKGVEWFVDTDPQRAIVYVRGRGNLSLDQADALVREVEGRLIGMDGISSVFAFAGEAGLDTLGGDGPPDAVGQVQIELSPWRERYLRADPLTGKEVMAAVARRIENVPGGVAEISEQKEGPTAGKPIQLRLESNDAAALEAATERARALFDGWAGLLDVDDTRPLPGVEWRLDVDRAAAGRHDASVADVGGMVQLVTRGVILDTATPDDSDEEIDIIARLPEDARTLEMLDALRLRTEDGLVPLANFVTRTAERRIDTIARYDGVRFFLVRANVANDADVNPTIAEMQSWLDANPEAFGGVSAKFVGDFEDQAETETFLGNAFIAALGLMFMILLAQFNSVYSAVLVLSAVVMSLAGVLIGMLVMDQTFSIIMTGTGVVALAGIVVNNNIVLIDTYHDYARRMPALDAVARAAEDRLRPVLLTTITTIAGLAPMVIAASIDFANRQISIGAPSALWWVPLSTAVVFGLGVATVLTLVVTPAALAARHWAQTGARAVLTRLSRKRTSAPDAASPALEKPPAVDIAAE